MQGVSLPPRFNSEGASTLPLVSLLAMTLSWLLFLLPYPAFSRLLDGSAGFFDKIATVATAGASLWATALFLIKHRIQAHSQLRLLSYSSEFPDSVFATSPLVPDLYRSKGIGLRLLGNPES